MILGLSDINANCGHTIQITTTRFVNIISVAFLKEVALDWHEQERLRYPQEKEKRSTRKEIAEELLKDGCLHVSKMHQTCGIRFREA